MAGGTIASLVARVGADTSDFHGKMDGALIKAGSVQAGFDRIGKRIEGGISQPLLLAGLAATKFGGQITSTFADAAGVTSKLQIQTNGLFMATGRLADSALLAVASLGKLSAVKISASTFSAGVLGIVTAVAAASWELGRFIATLTGLDNWLREKAVKPAEQLADVLAHDEERYQMVREQVQQLAHALRLSGPEWDISSKRTKENAVRLSELNDQLLDSLNRRKQIAEAGPAYLATLAAEPGIHRRNIETLDVLRAKFNETYGVMTKSQIADALGKLAKDIRAMAFEGISWAQVMDKVAPKFRELAEAAATYAGFDMPGEAKALGEAFRDDTGAALDGLLKQWATMGPAVKSGVDESRRRLEEMGKTLEGTVKGGFHDGIAGGISDATKELERWAAGAVVRIPVELDTSGLQRQIEEIKRGRIPVTTGSAP
jgi:hypothetical protein